MKNENDQLDQMFANLTNQWDIHTIKTNHEHRFLNKLKPSKFKLLLPVAIAASIAFLFCLTILHQPEQKQKEFTFASRETKQTDSIFTVIIERELEKIKDKIQVPICEKIKEDFFFIISYLKKKCYYILNKNDI